MKKYFLAKKKIKNLRKYLKYHRKLSPFAYFMNIEKENSTKRERGESREGKKFGKTRTSIKLKSHGGVKVTFKSE